MMRQHATLPPLTVRSKCWGRDRVAPPHQDRQVLLGHFSGEAVAASFGTRMFPDCFIFALDSYLGDCSFVKKVAMPSVRDRLGDGRPAGGAFTQEPRVHPSEVPASGEEHEVVGTFGKGRDPGQQSSA